MPTVAADSRHQASQVKTKTRSSWRWSLVPELALACALVLAGLELIFFAAGLGEQEYLQPDRATGTAPTPGKHVTWRQEGFSRTSFNSAGMRDIERRTTKPPKTFRVAVLGDSYVESLQVEPDRSFCQLVENRLNAASTDTHFEVMNFGVSAYNLGQMYLRLKSLALNFKPDLVILAMRIDQAPQLDPYAHGGLIFARPTFSLDAKKNLKQDNTVQDAWLKSPDGQRTQGLSWLRANSRVWGVISLSVQHLVRNNQNELCGYRERPFDQQWPIAHALIKAVNDLCNQEGCRFMLLALPGPGPDHNDRQLKLLSNSAITFGIPCLNLTPAFNQAFAKGANLYFTSHMNESGHQLLADELSKFLKQNDLTKPQP
jgi:lysophospholipase L1-like esterase